jgi:hypothetical protein
MQKFIIPLLTVVMVVSITLAGCVPATPPIETPPEAPPEAPEAPPITPTPPETPPEAPEAPTALPQPGEWNASTGATEFTFTFTVNSDSTGITNYTLEFEEFGCGGYHVGKLTSSVGLGEPIPINPLPSGAEFSLVDDLEVYSAQGEDPLTGMSGWIHIYWHIVVEGQFDETGTQASGTWAISSTGKEHTFSSFSSPPSSAGTVCQEGTWSASAP